MPTVLSNFAKRTANVAVATLAGGIVVNDFYIDLATTDLTLNNVIDLGLLPAGHTITDAILIPTDMDTGTTLTLDVGLMSGTPGDGVPTRTVGTELFAASTAAQTGVAARVSAVSAFTIAASQADRSIGVKIAAAPTGAVAGRIRLRVLSHPVNSGFVF